MNRNIRKRRLAVVFSVSLLLLAVGLFEVSRQPAVVELKRPKQQTSAANISRPKALDELKLLEIKGRAPKTGYTREQFSSGWSELGLCDTRNLILRRDLSDIQVDADGCTVIGGVLKDPYTGQLNNFNRQQTSRDIHIDHVVALSDAWQKGAQQLSTSQRRNFYHDELNLLTVAGWVNMQKGDGDAATWLPPNKAFRCQYVARQIAVKSKYDLWITRAEYSAKTRILQNCPDQRLPSP